MYQVSPSNFSMTKERFAGVQAVELATDMIGTFSSRKRSGRPSSSTQHEQHERLNSSFGH